MTHEVFAGDDERGGPELDLTLPPADTIPGDLSADGSDAPPWGD